MVFGRGLFGFSLWLLVVLFLPVFVLGFDYDGSGFSRPLASSLDSPVLAFEDSSSSGSLSVSGSDDLVYRYGFYSLGGGSWERFDLSGQGLHGVWFVGGADSSLGFSSDDFGLSPGGLASDNYVLVFTCSYISSSRSWDCHGGRWQLSPFNATLAEEPAGCSSDAGCDDGNPCTSDSCVGGSCSNVALADGSSCLADGDVCTYDRCESGVCSHPLIPGCGEVECVSHASSACLGGDVYWYDSCGAVEELRFDCGSGESCVDGACVADSGVSGDVVYVSNPGEGNDIRPALEAAWNRASAGDTILLPAGSFSYTGSRIFASYYKPGIHIKGAGSGPGGTKLYRTSETSDYMMQFYCTSSSGATEAEIEISDIWFQAMDTRLNHESSGSTYPVFQGVGLRACDFYVHDNRFQYFSARALSTSHLPGSGRGLVYNNEFIDNVAFRDGDPSRGYGVGVSVWGDVQEWVDVSPGTDGFVFIEDNYFSGQRHAVSGASGSLYVFRHNLVERNTANGMVDMHGGYNPATHPHYVYSTRFTEVYGNTFVATPSDDAIYESGNMQGVYVRGGESLIFGNVFRSFPRPPVFLTIEGSWFRDSVYDIPSGYEVPAYPIRYQVGWESGDRYGSGHSGTGSSTYGAGDVFVWDNEYVNCDGSPDVQSPFTYDGVSYDYIQEGRDYHVGVARPGYSPYDYPHPRRR